VGLVVARIVIKRSVILEFAFGRGIRAENELLSKDCCAAIRGCIGSQALNSHAV